ncbi:hypothetical protein EVAR_48613_1 [Eumeta japonica]|uniref:Uncharacterized protein n=1 Tax=Eumeta variegata TaxID=151549 RepID=A0A4C1Y125_EUMVA|nr:hypothetical protein EVAR_48613_1 [Eumeta japonica]
MICIHCVDGRRFPVAAPDGLPDGTALVADYGSAFPSCRLPKTAAIRAIATPGANNFAFLSRQEPRCLILSSTLSRALMANFNLLGHGRGDVDWIRPPRARGPASAPTLCAGGEPRLLATAAGYELYLHFVNAINSTENALKEFVLKLRAVNSDIDEF